MGELDNAIEEKRKQVERLRKAAAELPIVESDLNALVRAKEILNGKSTPAAATLEYRAQSKGKASVADAAEKILSEVTELHAGEILKRLDQQFGIKTSKQVVVGTILRYANQGRRFKRTKPNTFAKL